MKKENGNVVIVTMMVFAMMLVILLLVVGVFMGNINGILHGVKTDLYLVNKSAMIAVNKNRGKVDVFSYNEKEYLKYFKNTLRKNYHLDENLENPKGLIQKVTVEEYKIYERNQKDATTGKRVDKATIHTVVTVKIKPIILEKQLEKLFVFRMHEDVAMERAKT